MPRTMQACLVPCVSSTAAGSRCVPHLSVCLLLVPHNLVPCLRHDTPHTGGASHPSPTPSPSPNATCCLQGVMSYVSILKQHAAASAGGAVQAMMFITGGVVSGFRLSFVAGLWRQRAPLTWGMGQPVHGYVCEPVHAVIPLLVRGALPRPFSCPAHIPASPAQSTHAPVVASPTRPVTPLVATLPTPLPSRLAPPPTVHPNHPSCHGFHWTGALGHHFGGHRLRHRLRLCFHHHA